MSQTLDATRPASSGPTPASNPTDLIALAAVSFPGAAVRMAYVRSESMRGDEAFTYNEYASKSLADVFNYTFPNNHLLNTLLSSLATARLGRAPWVVRLPALVAGVLLIPATYLLVRRLADR